MKSVCAAALSGLMAALSITACGDGGGGGGGGGGKPGDSCDCLKSYSANELSAEDIQRLQDEGLPKCFSDDVEELESQAQCLPFEVGEDPSTGAMVEVFYFCSDVCPDAGGVGIRYAGIQDKGACCAIGGDPLVDPAWGGFVGCAPTVLELPAAQSCAD